MLKKDNSRGEVMVVLIVVSANPFLAGKPSLRGKPFPERKTLSMQRHTSMAGKPITVSVTFPDRDTTPVQGNPSMAPCQGNFPWPEL